MKLDTARSMALLYAPSIGPSARQAEQCKCALGIHCVGSGCWIGAEDEVLSVHTQIFDKFESWSTVAVLRRKLALLR
jgi:hypothetical protein